MNPKTGETKEEENLTKKQKSSGHWKKLSAEEAKLLRGMNRHQRRTWWRKNKKGRKA